jgi:hypothetical protein
MLLVSWNLKLSFSALRQRQRNRPQLQKYIFDCYRSSKCLRCPCPSVCPFYYFSAFLCQFIPDGLVVPEVALRSHKQDGLLVVLPHLLRPLLAHVVQRVGVHHWNNLREPLYGKRTDPIKLADDLIDTCLTFMLFLSYLKNRPEIRLCWGRTSV